MRKNTKNGIFIVIDGTNGSGKATQTKLLVKALKDKGLKVKMMDFPRYGEKSAAMVEKYLNGGYGEIEEVGPYRASIFYACDRYDASFEIKKSLNAGKIVISNRYTTSSMAHQAGQISNITKRKKFLKWLDNLEFEIFKIPRPDLRIILHNDPKTSQEWVDRKSARKYIKGKKRDIHEADLKHLQKAADGYKYVAKLYHIPLINANQPVEEVHRQIMGLVGSAFN